MELSLIMLKPNGLVGFGPVLVGYQVEEDVRIAYSGSRAQASCRT